MNINVLNIYIYNLNEVLINELNDILCISTNRLNPLIYTAYKNLDDVEVKSCVKKVYPYIHLNQIFTDIYGDIKYVESTSFTKEITQIESRDNFFKHFSDLYDALNEIIYLYNTVGPIENFNDNYKRLDNFTIRSIILLFSISIVKLRKLYTSISNSEIVFLNPNEIIVFKNMYNIVLKIPGIFLIEPTNTKTNLNNNSNSKIKIINNDTNINKGWNVYGHVNKSNPNMYNLYRKNVEFGEHKNYYNEIFSDIHLIYVYYAILYFVTNPERIMQ